MVHVLALVREVLDNGTQKYDTGTWNEIQHISR